MLPDYPLTHTSPTPKHSVTENLKTDTHH